MKFGRLAVAAGEGAILAHAIKRPGLTLRKGERVSADHIAALEAAGVESIIAAKLEPGDVHENEAARQLAEWLAGPNVKLERAFTGRCNLIADVAGLVILDHEGIDRINAVDETITVATLMPFRPVVSGEMIATVKIIPFAVPWDPLERALRETASGALHVAPFRPLRVGVVSTLLPGLKASTVAKTLQILEARLAPAGATIVDERRVRHEVGALIAAIAAVAAGADLVVVFGASAITDRRDVIPTAIEGAGGTVMHLGMPVDPGNLLLLGRLERRPLGWTHPSDKPSLSFQRVRASDRTQKSATFASDALAAADGGAIPVIGAPGCARSPKENGFDFVLRRLLAGLTVTGLDLRRMGVGGLLSEIMTRPQPRNALDG